MAGSSDQALREPRAFISFKHNRNMTWIANQLKFGLNQRFVEVYRLIDDPRTGALFTQQIDEGIEWSDFVVALWSDQGAASHYVRYEYRKARELPRAIALVKTTEAPLPPDWNPDERYETLDMVVWPRGIFADTHDPNFGFRPGQQKWRALLDRLSAFARRARDGEIPAHVGEGSW